MAGPTTCKECHGKVVKRYETINIDKLSKVYEPVRFSHSGHIDITPECKECHHEKGGMVVACSTCHKPLEVYRYEDAKKENTAPGLKGPYHGMCLGCHKKMGNGPLGCSECHKKKVKK
jgi:hypothetical protein